MRGELASSLAAYDVAADMGLIVGQENSAYLLSIARDGQRMNAVEKLGEGLVRKWGRKLSATTTPSSLHQLPQRNEGSIGEKGGGRWWEACALHRHVQAANNGAAGALRECARHALEGIGRAANQSQAEILYSLAAARGDAESLFTLGRLAEKAPSGVVKVDLSFPLSPSLLAVKQGGLSH